MVRRRTGCLFPALADVAELADALASGASGRKVVSVRVGPSALLGSGKQKEREAETKGERVGRGGWACYRGAMSSTADRVRPNQVVSFHYVVSLSGGKEVDRTGERPMSYLHGHGGIIPGLEIEMEGKATGDKFEIAVPARDAYGELLKNSTKTYPKDSFPKEVAVGMQFAVDAQGGQTVPVWIREVKKDRVVVDRNHPLAGKNLNFSVEIVEVRAATPEELAHGHAHSPHEHHH